VDPVPDPLLLREFVSARDRTRTSGSVARNSDHYTTEAVLRPKVSSINCHEVRINSCLQFDGRRAAEKQRICSLLLKWLKALRTDVCVGEDCSRLGFNNGWSCRWTPTFEQQAVPSLLGRNESGNDTSNGCIMSWYRALIGIN
jgi:hypothetical protein